jgi:hypothetical protein
MSTKRARAESHTPRPGKGRLKGVAAGIDALQTMNPFLEAERDRWKQLAEIANPCKGVLEGLQMQSIRLDSAALIGTESLRRMAEDCAPRFSSFGIGLGSDAIGVLGSIGNLSAFGDLHAEMRIHAVPRLPSLPPPLALGDAQKPCRTDRRAGPSQSLQAGKHQPAGLTTTSMKKAAKGFSSS